MKKKDDTAVGQCGEDLVIWTLSKQKHSSWKTREGEPSDVTVSTEWGLQGIQSKVRNVENKSYTYNMRDQGPTYQRRAYEGRKPNGELKAVNLYTPRYHAFVAPDLDLVAFIPTVRIMIPGFLLIQGSVTLRTRRYEYSKEYKTSLYFEDFLVFRPYGFEDD